MWNSFVDQKNAKNNCYYFDSLSLLNKGDMKLP